MGEIDLFSTRSVAFLETWPSSGMTRSGWAFELPTPALRTVATESSFLPTPQAHDAVKGKSAEQVAAMRARGHGVWNLNEVAENELVLLKTPTSQLAVNGGSQHPDKRKAGGHGPTLADEVEHLLPTPVASEGVKATARQGSARKSETGQVWLTNVAHDLAVLNGESTDPSSGESTSPRSDDGSSSPGE